MKTKVCTKCKEEQPIDKFSTNKNTKDGLTFWCKGCVKKYCIDNKERITYKRKQYYQNNKEKSNIYNQQYRKDNKEWFSAYHKQYSIDHKEEMKATRLRYNIKNRKKIAKKSREFAQNNPDIIFARYLKTTYNMSVEDYEKRLRRQGGTCYICRNTEDERKQRRRLSIDHNHTTGEVRGLLCSKCNIGLGCFRDNPDLLIKASKYLSTG